MTRCVTGSLIVVMTKDGRVSLGGTTVLHCMNEVGAAVWKQDHHPVVHPAEVGS